MDIHGVRFCYETGIYTGAFRLDARLLHSQTSDSNSVNRTLLSGFLATQRYKVHPYAMDIHGVRFCYETGIYTGAFRLDARLLHSQTSDSNSVNRTLLSGFLATQRYKVHPYAMDIHGVRFCYETGIYTGAFRLDARLLHSQTSDSNS